jgi:hydroxymethylglutaryl-CoA lyase
LGKGGCPMAKDDLTGNMPTENIITYLKSLGIELSLNDQALSNSIELAKEIF